jgi:hypothetical protein
MKKIISNYTHLRQCFYQQCPRGFRFIHMCLQSRALQIAVGLHTFTSNSFTHTCKHEPINQLPIDSEFVDRFDRQNPHPIINPMRIWIEPGRGSSSILSVAFFSISSVVVSSVAISSNSIVFKFASLPNSCALNYNATSNPNCDLKIVKLTFALRESRKKLEMEPQWEHDQARGGGSKGSRERGSKTMHGVGWMKTSQGVGSGGDQGHAWGGGKGHINSYEFELQKNMLRMAFQC